MKPNVPKVKINKPEIANVRNISFSGGILTQTPEEVFSENPITASDVATIASGIFQSNAPSMVGGSVVEGIPEAPIDGKPYARKDETWVKTIPEAPIDGKTYARKDQMWVEIKTITIDICVDGMKQKLDIYTNGNPY